MQPCPFAPGMAHRSVPFLLVSDRQLHNSSRSTMSSLVAGREGDAGRQELTLSRAEGRPHCAGTLSLSGFSPVAALVWPAGSAALLCSEAVWFLVAHVAPVAGNQPLLCFMSDLP